MRANAGILPILISLAVSAGADGPLRVRSAKDGTLTVAAHGAGLIETIEAIGRETGMDLVIEGPTPAVRIDVELKDVTPAAALTQLLSDAGFAYASTFDTTSTRFVKLIVFTSSLKGKPGAAAAHVPDAAPEAVVEAAAAAESVPAEAPKEDAAPAEPKKPAAGPTFLVVGTGAAASGAPMLELEPSKGEPPLPVKRPEGDAPGMVVTQQPASGAAPPPVPQGRGESGVAPPLPRSKR